MPPRSATWAQHRKSRTPRGHWALVSLLVFVFAIGLLIEGFTHGVLGENSGDEPSATPGAPAAPASVTSGGPVLTVLNGQPRSFRIPPKTVVLSFDDGPDPAWTPKILAVLSRYQVPADFFLVGAHAASYPGLVQAELRDGDEVGSHTYTHVNLGTSPRWRENLELTLTQNALAGAAGARTRLLRMPYSSEPDAMSAADWRAANQAAQDGYLVVFTSLDTRDWAMPGVGDIVRATMPEDGRGAIIMFHDGGGDRSETVAALPLVIQRLRAAGYRFETVTGALHLAAGDAPVSGAQTVVGATLVLIQQAADKTTVVLAVALSTMSVLTVLRLLLLVGLAAAHRHRERRERSWIPPYVEPFLPDVSVIIPAYNEAAGIAATVRSMAASRYRGRLEIIVVDDGSTDGTAAIARGLGIPYVHVISQRNTGKPGALNRGIAAAHSEVLVLVDGDTVFEPDTIERLVAPFLDPRVGAVSGNTKVANRRGFLGGWQHLEYVMGFNLDRRMYDMLGVMPTVPGAIGAFRKRALRHVGGVSHDTLAEDTDLTMALCRTRWRICYTADAVAWTEAPASLHQLWRQRYRWSYGTMQAMWKHRRAVIERGRSGRFGRLCLTYLVLFQVLLPLVAPAIDVSSCYGLLFFNPVHVAAFWLSFVVLQAVAGGYALRIDHERLRALWVLPFQQVVYRQLMYLVTIQSVITALLGTRQHWQASRRTGVFSEDAALTDITSLAMATFEDSQVEAAEGGAKPGPGGRLGTLTVLGALSAFGPLAMDMYLPSTPTIAAALHAGQSLVQLTLSGCLAGLAAGQLVAGPVSDGMGRRRPLLIGLVAFVALSAACAAAPDIWSLIVFRFLQGMAGAVGVVLSLTIVRDLYEGTELARVLSSLMLVFGLAPVLAPVIGGQILRFTSWRGVFGVLAAVGLVLLAASWFLPETLPPERRTPPRFRQLIGDSRTLVRDRQYAGNTLAITFSTAALITYISALPFIVEDAYHQSPQVFSLFFAINSVGLVAMAQLGARLIRRLPVARVVHASLLVMAAGAVVFLATALTGGLPLVALLLPLFVFVASFGMFRPNGTALALADQGSIAGTASAWLGALPFMLGAVLSPLAGLGGQGSATVAGVLLAALCALALGSQVLVTRLPRLRQVSQLC